MGMCKFCGKNAGLFKSVHPVCEFNHETGIINKEYEQKMQSVVNDYKTLTDKIVNREISPDEALKEMFKISSVDIDKNRKKINYKSIFPNGIEAYNKVKDNLTVKEIKYIKGWFFPTISIEEYFDMKIPGFHGIISWLGRLKKPDNYNLCEKLFSIIDDYIPTCKYYIFIMNIDLKFI